MAAHPLLFVFPFAMAYAALMDIFTMRIANGVSIAVGVAFLIVAPIAGMPAQEMLMHLGVGAAMLIVGMILFSFRALGGGDAKLLAAASLWVGPDQWLPFVALVAVFGGVLAVVILIFRNFPAGALMLPAWAQRPTRPAEPFPMVSPSPQARSSSTRRRRGRRCSQWAPEAGSQLQTATAVNLALTFVLQCR